MMMCVCVCVLILPVCFTRPHGMFLVLYRVTNHMAGPPPLTERNWYIYVYIWSRQRLRPLELPLPQGCDFGIGEPRPHLVEDALVLGL